MPEIEWTDDKSPGKECRRERKRHICCRPRESGERWISMPQDNQQFSEEERGQPERPYSRHVSCPDEKRECESAGQPENRAGTGRNYECITDFRDDQVQQEEEDAAGNRSNGV